MGHTHPAAPIRPHVPHPPPPRCSPRRQRPPSPAAESPAHAPGGGGPGEGDREGRVLKGPLSLSSGMQEGSHPPSGLGAGGQSWRERANRPLGSPSLQTSRESPHLSREGLSVPRGAPRGPSPSQEGVAGLPGPPGRSRVGGGGGGGDSAALRPPASPELCSSWSRRCYRNGELLFPNVRAARQEGGRPSQGGPRPCHAARRTASQTAHRSPALTPKPGFLKVLGPSAQGPPNSDPEC